MVLERIYSGPRNYNIGASPNRQTLDISGSFVPVHGYSVGIPLKFKRHRSTAPQTISYLTYKRASSGVYHSANFTYRQKPETRMWNGSGPRWPTPKPPCHLNGFPGRQLHTETQGFMLVIIHCGAGVARSWTTNLRGKTAVEKASHSNTSRRWTDL